MRILPPSPFPRGPFSATIQTRSKKHLSTAHTRLETRTLVSKLDSLAFHHHRLDLVLRLHALFSAKKRFPFVSVLYRSFLDVPITPASIPFQLVVFCGNIPMFSEIEKWREKEYKEKWFSEFEIKYSFPIHFPTGFRISPGFREKLRNWQRLSYVKPYERMENVQICSCGGL